MAKHHSQKRAAAARQRGMIKLSSSVSHAKPTGNAAGKLVGRLLRKLPGILSARGRRGTAAAADAVVQAAANRAADELQRQRSRDGVVAAMSAAAAAASVAAAAATAAGSPLAPNAQQAHFLLMDTLRQRRDGGVLAAGVGGAPDGVGAPEEDGVSGESVKRSEGEVEGEDEGTSVRDRGFRRRSCGNVTGTNAAAASDTFEASTCHGSSNGSTTGSSAGSGEEASTANQDSADSKEEMGTMGPLEGEGGGVVGIEVEVEAGEGTEGGEQVEGGEEVDEGYEGEMVGKEEEEVSGMAAGDGATSDPTLDEEAAHAEAATHSGAAESSPAASELEHISSVWAMEEVEEELGRWCWMRGRRVLSGSGCRGEHSRGGRGGTGRGSAGEKCAGAGRGKEGPGAEFTGAEPRPITPAAVDCALRDTF
ncbi:unnamed protein product [Closterium sp. NIES-65]|nr:unnamed protein product [Closterium sp. NIES-65]